MPEKQIPRWIGIVLLLVVATTFGANHLAARIAFDHGANVTTAVAFRSTGTAIFVLVLLVLNRVSLAVTGKTFGHATLIGLALAVQSYCLYSAVALVPVALALDVWGEGGDMSGRWGEIGAGVLWATGAAVSFAAVLYLTTRWLNDMDGRLRSFLTMCVISVVILAGGAAAGDFKLPADGTGWIALALLTAFYGIAITSMFVLLPRLGAVNNAVVLNFEPISLLALGWVILDQKVAPLQILGAFIVVGAIMVLGSGKR